MTRWPVIRHVRWWLARRRIEEWQTFCCRYGFDRHYNDMGDAASLARIWRGEL